MLLQLSCTIGCLWHFLKVGLSLFIQSHWSTLGFKQRRLKFHHSLLAVHCLTRLACAPPLGKAALRYSNVYWSALERPQGNATCLLKPARCQRGTHWWTWPSSSTTSASLKHRAYFFLLELQCQLACPSNPFKRAGLWRNWRNWRKPIDLHKDRKTTWNKVRSRSRGQRNALQSTWKRRKQIGLLWKSSSLGGEASSKAIGRGATRYPYSRAQSKSECAF